MLASIPLWLRVPLAVLLLIANTLAHVVPLFAAALVKALVPIPAWRRVWSRVLVVLAESWIGVNSALIGVFTPTRWHVEGLDELRGDASQLVISNHQSWVDIPVLQKVFNRRVPFMRFFLKQQLFWVPVMGLAWWALDFPFMRRHSREQLAKRPELRGRDREATRRACARYRGLRVAVMNFVEGTRFTDAKHAQQQSPYKHLLRPRAGGIAFALDAMDGALRTLLDVTIVYPGGRPRLIDLITGRVREVRVHARQMPVAEDLLRGDYEGDADYRARFQDWINDLWQQKDARIAAMLDEAAG